MANLVPRAFLGQGEARWEKTLALADQMIFKHLGKLGVIIAFYWGQRIKNRIQGLVSSQGIFLQCAFHCHHGNSTTSSVKKAKRNSLHPTFLGV